MTKDKKSTPDYKFWSKLDGWSFKDAALLLHGIDPLEYKKVKFNTREVPSEPELKEAYKTFLIFKSINWGNARTYTDTSVVPPLKILDAATYKDIDIPKELSTHVNERYKREKEIIKTVTSESASNEKLTTREYRNNLKQIGYMSHIIADCHCSRYQFKINNRPNAHQITQAILDKAFAHIRNAHSQLTFFADAIKNKAVGLEKFHGVKQIYGIVVTWDEYSPAVINSALLNKIITLGKQNYGNSIPYIVLSINQLEQLQAALSKSLHPIDALLSLFDGEFKKNWSFLTKNIKSRDSYLNKPFTEWTEKHLPDKIVSMSNEILEKETLI